MITPVILPQLGDTMDVGTLTRWFKREGDAVIKGEPLFEVLTDKANIEVEATTNGFLRQVLAPENAVVPTGQIIAYLTTTPDEPLEAADNGKQQAVRERTDPQELGSAEVPSATFEPAAPRKRQFISPRARRVAREYGVDLSQLRASSQTGRIMEADVRRYLASAPASISAAEPPRPAPVPVPSGQEGIVPIEGVRKIIFERMSASAREIARVTLTTEADATRLVDLRAELNARQGEMKFSFTDLLALLVSRALLKYLYMNATLHDDGIHQHALVHLGIATDTERGLLVPVIRDAHRKGLGEIFADIRRLSQAARTGKISPDDLRGSTFTITNLGQYEIDSFTPIVNQPETAILGVGRIAKKPAAFEGQLVLRWMVALSLSFDHRVVDGAPAAQFLQHVKHLIETPSLVLL